MSTLAMNIGYGLHSLSKLQYHQYLFFLWYTAQIEATDVQPPPRPPNSQLLTDIMDSIIQVSPSRRCWDLVVNYLPQVLFGCNRILSLLAGSAGVEGGR